MMQCNKLGLYMVSVLAFGAMGCSSSSPSVPLTSTTGDTTDGGTADGGTTDGGTTDGGTTSGGSSAEIGDNPGLVFRPILAELTTINLSDLGGHVVYAGPAEVFFEGYSYVNINFNCEGAGTFELFPAAQFASFQPTIKGTIAWSVSSDGEDVDVDITAVTEGGGGEGEFDADDITVNPVSAGTLIVGESTLQSKTVSAILQYEECG